MHGNRDGNMLATILTSFLFLNRFAEAIIEVKYNTTSFQSGLKWMRCSENLRDFTYCAGAMNTTHCIPLSRDWCQSMLMSANLMYIVKHETKETMGDNMINTYEYFRDIPMFVDVGAEIELQFTLYPGWESMSIDLHDVVDDLCIHIKIRNTNDLTFTSRVAGLFSAEEGILGDYFPPVETPITLRIICTSIDFQINVDGLLKWNYSYRKPLQDVKQIGVFFIGTPGDVHWAKYKTP